MTRVLRPGGHLGSATSSASATTSAFHADCAAGAITVAGYYAMLRRAGLTDVSVQPTDAIGGGLQTPSSAPPKPVVAVRAMEPGDWPAVRTIYEAGVASGNATFEAAAPAWDEWDRSHLADHRLVATDAVGRVVGWAALSPVSDRCAYVGVAENSVYVDPAHQRRGIGSLLLQALITQAEDAGFWTIQTGIFPDNIASLTVHQRAGFRLVGRRERIGQLAGVWRDTIFLERRSDRL